MTLSALSPIPYLSILAGALKMHFYDFLLYGVLMRTIRFAVVAYLFFIILM
jgi:membrane protein YqaA with SNARE-associated domain|tara:strand:- start:2393 stop:2545 length:153 start_codon:yes stop_codon:yes gene_type:complete